MFNKLYNDENLKLFANSLPGALLVYKWPADGTDELLFLSETAEELWEVKQQDALKNIGLLWQVIFPEDIPPMVESIKKSGDENSFWNHTYRIKTKSGKVKWLNGRATTSKQDDGSIIWQTIILEITDLKTLEEELTTKSEKLDHYAEKLSHDLRARLAALMGLLKLVEEHKDDEILETKSLLNELLSNSHQLDEIVRDMAKDLDL